MLAAVLIGGAAGFKQGNEAGVGESGRADAALDRSMRDDPEESVLVQSRSFTAGQTAFRDTVDDVVRDLLAALVSQRKEVSQAVLRRGIAEGALPADADLDLLIDLLGWAVVYRTCIAGRSVDPKTVDRIVATVLNGAAGR